MDKRGKRARKGYAGPTQCKIRTHTPGFNFLIYVYTSNHRVLSVYRNFKTCYTPIRPLTRAMAKGCFDR